MTALEALAAARRPRPEQLAEALKQARAFFAEYLYAEDGVLDLLAAFAGYTYTWEVFDTAVYLMVTSPTRRCGKSRARELIELLGHRVLSAGSITAAALVRLIEDERPVLILDEADGIGGLGEDGAALLRAVLNEGTRRGGRVFRCQGRENRPTAFSAFCPKVLVGIGEFLAPTTRDRTIQLRLQRKPAGTAVSRLRWSVANAEAAPIREALGLFAGIEPPEVEPLASQNDRYADAAEPLLAVAAAAGHQWEHRVRHALLALEDGDAEPSLGEATLLAVARVFNDRGAENIASAELCASLNAIEDGPWQGLRGGQGINPHLLAKILKTFGLIPRTVRLAGGKTAKGYPGEQVVSVARNYGLESVTTSRCSADADFRRDGLLSTRHETSREKCNGDRYGDVVTVGNGGIQDPRPPVPSMSEPVPAHGTPSPADTQGRLFDEEDAEVIL